MSLNMKKCKADVLLIEDNPGDILLVKEILMTNTESINLNVVTNGEEALAFLHRSGEFSGAPEPDLMILDLNLPKISGKGILEEMNKDLRLKNIPVIVFSSAEMDDNIFINSSYNIKYYLVKPLDLDEYIAAVQFMKDFINSMLNQENKS